MRTSYDHSHEAGRAASGRVSRRRRPPVTRDQRSRIDRRTLPHECSSRPRAARGHCRRRAGTHASQAVRCSRADRDVVIRATADGTALTQSLGIFAARAVHSLTHAISLLLRSRARNAVRLRAERHRRPLPSVEPAHVADRPGVLGRRRRVFSRRRNLRRDTRGRVPHTGVPRRSLGSAERSRRTERACLLFVSMRWTRRSRGAMRVPRWVHVHRRIRTRSRRRCRRGVLHASPMTGASRPSPDDARSKTCSRLASSERGGRCARTTCARPVCDPPRHRSWARSSAASVRSAAASPRCPSSPTTRRSCRRGSGRSGCRSP